MKTFVNLALLWRKEEGILKHAIETLTKMIDDAAYVCTHAWEATSMGQTVVSEKAKTLKGFDKAINQGERIVREIVVEHLTINPREDVAGCLALMNMAKDAERVGDHGTNILDIAIATQGNACSSRFADRLAEGQRQVVPLFPMLHDAILDSDEQRAHEVLDRYQQAKAHIKQLQKDVLATDFPAREAMYTLLLVVHLRRINAHLANIASGIIFPIQNIDFISRGLREERQET